MSRKSTAENPLEEEVPAKRRKTVESYPPIIPIEEPTSSAMADKDPDPHPGEYCDFIADLEQKEMLHVVDQILGYLDCKSMKQAEVVSTTWHGIIHDNKVKWKNFFIKNKTLFAAMNVKDRSKYNKELADHPATSKNYYKRACEMMGKELEYAEGLWSTGRFGDQQELISQVGSDYLLDMNAHWIVYIPTETRGANKDITVRSRWRIDKIRKKNILLPAEGFRNRGIRILVSSLKINESYIVASLERCPEITVWNATTFELITILDTNEELPDESFNTDEDEFYFVELKHYLFLSGSLLFSYRKRVDMPGVATLWKLPKETGEKASILYRNEIAYPFPVKDVAMDENFIVLFFGKSGSSIIVRRTNSYEVVCTIPLKQGDYSCFHYEDGKIAAAKKTGVMYIQIWDALTGACLGTISNDDGVLGTLRFVSDRFLITRNKTGKIKSYDTAAALDKSSEGKVYLSEMDGFPDDDSPSYHHIHNPSYPLVADVLQLATFYFDQEHPSEIFLYVKNFCEAELF